MPLGRENLPGPKEIRHQPLLDKCDRATSPTAGMDFCVTASYLIKADIFLVCASGRPMVKDDDERPSSAGKSDTEVEARMTRFVLGEIRRYVLLTMGLTFLIAGLIVLPLPIPFGLAMILIGLSLLLVNSPFIRSRFLVLRSRWSRMDAWISSVEHRLPGPVRRAIRPDGSD